MLFTHVDVITPQNCTNINELVCKCYPCVFHTFKNRWLLQLTCTFRTMVNIYDGAFLTSKNGKLLLERDTASMFDRVANVLLLIRAMVGTTVVYQRFANVKS